MNAIATQDYIHDPTFQHSCPSVFIRGDLMLRPYILDNMIQIFLWQIATVIPIKGTRTSVNMPGFQIKSLTITIVCGNDFLIFPPNFMACFAHMFSHS